jgi:hypothetical protein
MSSSGLSISLLDISQPKRALLSKSNSSLSIELRASTTFGYLEGGMSDQGRRRLGGEQRWNGLELEKAVGVPEYEL